MIAAIEAALQLDVAEYTPAEISVSAEAGAQGIAAFSIELSFYRDELCKNSGLIGDPREEDIPISKQDAIEILKRSVQWRKP